MVGFIFVYLLFGRRSGVSIYEQVGSDLVCGVGKTVIYAAKLGIWRRLDTDFHFIGHFFVVGIDFQRKIQIETIGICCFWLPVDIQCGLVNYLFWDATTFVRAF